MSVNYTEFRVQQQDYTAFQQQQEEDVEQEAAKTQKGGFETVSCTTPCCGN